MGDIKIVLFPQQAPITVKNFLRYLKINSYDNTIFHRVVKNFVIQGGGFNKDFARKETFPAIKNESNNNLSNVRGSIAMARTSAPDSATNQFYINVVDNSRALDAKPNRPGYAVFGNVIEGMKVVDAISELPTTNHAMHNAVPQPLVTLKKAQLDYIDAETLKDAATLLAR